MIRSCLVVVLALAAVAVAQNNYQGNNRGNNYQQNRQQGNQQYQQSNNNQGGNSQSSQAERRRQWRNEANSKWTQRENCTCFCFHRDGMVNPPAWTPGKAPPKGFEPEPIMPPEDAPRGPTIFTDPVFLGGPPLWNSDSCRVRKSNERQYNVNFFCTCCCPNMGSFSGNVYGG